MRVKALLASVNNSGKKSHLFRRVSGSLVILSLLLSGPLASAESLDSLSSKVSDTDHQIGDLQGQVDDRAKQSADLTVQLGQMQAQVDALKDKLNRTHADIDIVTAQIIEVEQKMAVKRDILGEYVRSDYYLNSASTLEVLVGSANLSDYLDHKKYLEVSQQRINDLLSEIKLIKADLDRKKADLDKLNDDLAAEKAGVDAQMSLKNELLAKTRGEQANYQALLDQAEAARQRLNATIFKLMAGGPIQSKGKVKRGQVIGNEGSTGFSTGPHVHFGTYVNQQAVNPHQFLDPGRISWPMSNMSISQDFGPANWSNSKYTFHDGIDCVAPFGQPVQAAADGNIVINSFQPDGFGHYIVVDHGGGLWSLYGHMQ